MEYARLGYRQKFVPKKFFLKYGGEKIKNLSIMIKYRLYSKKTGLEILFEKNKNYINDSIKIDISENVSENVSENENENENENVNKNKEFTFQTLKKKAITDFINCSFDKKNLINIVVNEKELADLGYELEYEIIYYFKNVLDDKKINEEFVLTLISKDEFEKIIKENIEEFDNSNNYPTQTTGFEIYDKKEILENEDDDFPF